MFPIIPANTATTSFPENDEGIFGFGNDGTFYNGANLVSNAGVVATDSAAVGTARAYLTACEYGGDKGLFWGGIKSGNIVCDMSNLVSNAGVIASDSATTGVLERTATTGCSYGEDKGIVGFGTVGHAGAAYKTGITNLVSNAGVIASDTAAVGTASQHRAACEYGGDKGIFGFGNDGSYTAMTNLVSNAGVVSTDVAGIGTARELLAACSYGGDKGIFGYGEGNVPSQAFVSITNLVSNAGVVSTDVAGVGTARGYIAACEYGGDKGIFGFAATSGPHKIWGLTNLVSNAGVVATDVAAVGTKSYARGGCSFN